MSHRAGMCPPLSVSCFHLLREPPLISLMKGYTMAPMPNFSYLLNQLMIIDPTMTHVYLLRPITLQAVNASSVLPRLRPPPVFPETSSPSTLPSHPLSSPNANHSIMPFPLLTGYPTI